MRAMTADDLRDLFTAMLVRQVGGERRRWRVAVGQVRVHSLATHPHCNWSLAPSGTAREIAEIERLSDDLRMLHPIVEAA